MRRRLTILGAGESGTGAALLAKKKGLDAFVSDNGPISPGFKRELEENGISYEEGGHTLSKILASELVVKSPGIPDSAFIVSKIRNAGISIISEPEFAYRFCKGDIIAITGTNGKTTTTLLTYHLLKEGGKSVSVGGNLGTSFSRLLLKPPTEFYVIEMSSFQLDGIVRFKPGIAILLNISSDHLDRYDGSYLDYANSKLKICQQMDDDGLFIINGDDETIQDLMVELPEGLNISRISSTMKVSDGAFNNGNIMEFLPYRFNYDYKKAPLIGKHNQVNLAAAILVALEARVDRSLIEKAIKSFKNAPHRLERVGEINGTTFINDSKATNVQAVYHALEGIGGPIIWIAGGVDKGNFYDELDPFVEKIEALLCLGKDNSALQEYFGSLLPNVRSFDNLDECMAAALELSGPGKTVLLSPACASFDLFLNYEDRGDKFKAVFKELKAKNKKS